MFRSPTGTKPELKVETLVPMLKEAKAAIRHLHAENVRLKTDLEEGKALQRRLEAQQVELEQAQQALKDNDAKIKAAQKQVEEAQAYVKTLQTFNTDLHAQLSAENTQRDGLQRANAELLGQVSERDGDIRSLEKRLTREQETWKATEQKIAVLHANLEGTCLQRDRALEEAKKAKEDLKRVRATGKSLELLEDLQIDMAFKDTELAVLRGKLTSMLVELAVAKKDRYVTEAVAERHAAQITEVKADLETLKNLLAESELHRRKLENLIQELKGNIRVYCRVRPVSEAEAADAEHDSELAVDFPTTGDLQDRGLTITAPSGQTTQKYNFAFDRVFAPGTTQGTVFDELSDLIDSTLDGQKVCIFAYGQTGSGKTFTMLGDRENPGIIPRAMQQIFQSGQKQASQFSMQASMLEIHNEDIRDLLWSRKEDIKKPPIIHDANGVITVSDVTVVDVNRPEEVEKLLAQAMEKRTIGCTAFNEKSSRSHLVFSMRIEGRNTVTDAKVSGVLNLIDLAGSERVNKSGATGQRMKEAKAINKSLSALVDVMLALTNKKGHVPFRNSKLTHLLQPCLGGDAKTVMVLNVAPSHEFASDSLSALRFGAMVNTCTINVPKKNVVVPRG